MPSIQSGQVPLPTFGYGSRYDSVSYYDQDQRGTYPAHGSYGPYKYSAPPSASAHHQPNPYHSSSMKLPAPIGAPMLPSLRIDHCYAMDQAQYQHQRQQHSVAYQEQPSKAEKAIGGVSANLDYDMEQMGDFVTEMSVGMYEIYKSRICIADIDLIRSIKPGIMSPPPFRKWVLAVLNATRLPAATILLSLSYLTLRIRGLSARGHFVPPSMDYCSQMLTVALILGSKFLDDNTFQNKSWAEVSNIPVAELNRSERAWLAAFNHKLHYDSNCADGYSTWEEQWNSYKARAIHAVPAPSVNDGHLRRQQNFRQSLSSGHYSQQRPTSSHISRGSDFADGQYNSRPFSPYRQLWFNGHPGSEGSPTSASHTGPNTPDYYGIAQGGWGDAYRQQHAGNPTLPQCTPEMTAYYGAYQTSSYNNSGTTMWNCHGTACQCSQCRQVNFFQPPRYGPIVSG